MSVDILLLDPQVNAANCVPKSLRLSQHALEQGCSDPHAPPWCRHVDTDDPPVPCIARRRRGGGEEEKGGGKGGGKDERENEGGDEGWKEE